MADDLEAITEEQQEQAATLRRVAWLAGEFYASLRSVLPDALAHDMVRDWFNQPTDEDDDDD